MFKLYIFIRNDLASMSPGKACAQVAHAASQAAFRINNIQGGGDGTTAENEMASNYSEWEVSPIYDKNRTLRYGSDTEPFTGFGTTIVLNAGNGDSLESLYYSKLQPLYNSKDKISGLVIDPSYPLKDGSSNLAVELPTCAWLFADSDNPDVDRLLKNFNLYNGGAYV